MEVRQIIETLEREDRAIAASLRKLLQNCPDGRLEVTTVRREHRYYMVSDGHKQYLGKKDADLARSLMEKSYYQKLLKTVDKQCALLAHFLETFNPRALIQVYEDMHPERKKIVTPLVLPDEEFARQWKDEAELLKSLYPNKMEKPGEFFTQNGEQVRSKSEVLIANLLRHHNLTYGYELPLILPDGIIYPDFTVLNLRTRTIYYWEHEGMLDNPAYGERMVRKNTRYTRAGIYPGEQLIMSMESSEYPLSTKDIEALILKYLL
ncbi:MAG: hypothetical protein IKH74_00970 [Lachnospiraceae bacterium]|nr:hypothetical protein [Lachnospiraceae bacterium]